MSKSNNFQIPDISVSYHTISDTTAEDYVKNNNGTGIENKAYEPDGGNVESTSPIQDKQESDKNTTIEDSPNEERDIDEPETLVQSQSGDSENDSDAMAREKTQNQGRDSIIENYTSSDSEPENPPPVEAPMFVADPVPDAESVPIKESVKSSKAEVNGNNFEMDVIDVEPSPPSHEEVVPQSVQVNRGIRFYIRNDNFKNM